MATIEMQLIKVLARWRLALGANILAIKKFVEGIGTVEVGSTDEERKDTQYQSRRLFLMQDWFDPVSSGGCTAPVGRPV